MQLFRLQGHNEYTANATGAWEANSGALREPLCNHRFNQPSTRILLAVVVLGSLALPAFAQDIQAAAEDDAVPVQPVDAPEELTLQMMLEQGGVILWVIMALGFVTLMMAVYFFLTVTPRREVPQQLLKRTVSQIQSGDTRGAYQMCSGRPELLARVLSAGLKRAGHERYVVQEAMESEGERGAAALWQKISYLNNIGVIAPLLGLLGTVWGMIGAFSAIAFDNAQVKGLTMAYKVAQAMITTSAGLLLAIPALVAFYFLRGRVVKIIAMVESQASEVVELLTRNRTP